MDFQPFAKPYGDEDRRFQINLNDDGTFKSLKYGGKPEYLNTIISLKILISLNSGSASPPKGARFTHTTHREPNTPTGYGQGSHTHTHT